MKPDKKGGPIRVEDQRPHPIMAFMKDYLMSLAMKGIPLDHPNPYADDDVLNQLDINEDRDSNSLRQLDAKYSRKHPERTKEGMFDLDGRHYKSLDDYLLRRN